MITEQHIDSELKLRFLEPTELTIYTSDDPDSDEVETFSAGDTITVDLFGAEDSHLSIQFADGSISFVPQDFFEVVEIDANPQN